MCVLVSCVSQCLQQYRDLARGPKNKPRPDRHGLLGLLLSALDEKKRNCDAALAADAADAADAHADAAVPDADAATPVEPPE